MKRLLLIALAALAITACDDDGFRSPDLPQNTWEVGPILDGVSKSPGVPVRPFPVADGLAIDFPQSVDDGHIHYVTTDVGSLAGKTGLRLHYRIEADHGVQFLAASPRPTTETAYPGLLTLHFQRCGDDWLAMPPRARTGDPGTEDFRWWATGSTVPLQAGEHVLEVPFTDRWTAVEVSNSFPLSADNPNGNQDGFREALQNTCRAGFTMGGGDGFGHGAFATGPARFVIIQFTAY